MKTSDILGFGIGIATGSKEIGVDDVVDSIFGDLF